MAKDRPRKWWDKWWEFWRQGSKSATRPNKASSDVPSEGYGSSFTTLPSDLVDQIDPALPMEDFIDHKHKDSFKWDEGGTFGPKDLVSSQAGLTGKHKVLLFEQSLPECGPFRKEDGAILGIGHSTRVFKVRPPSRVTGFKQLLALKVIQCDGDKRKIALDEVKNMVPVEHVHIVAYVSSFEQTLAGRRQKHKRMKDGRRIIIDEEVILEYHLGIAMYPVGRCDLSRWMDAITDERRHIMYRFFRCLSQAVSYLHTQEIRLKHKDIKPGNIIIDAFNQPLLTDFGISKHYRKGQASRSDGPTHKTDKYACAQSTDETDRDYRSDVYSLGCVFLEMVTVILNEDLSDLEEFREAIDNKPPYCKTLPKLYSWLHKLEQDNKIWKQILLCPFCCRY